MTTKHTDMTDIWDRWAALWNGGLHLGEQLFTPDCEVHFGGVAGTPETDALRGPAEITQLIAGFRARFAELTYRTEVGPLVDGDQLAARWTAEVTEHSGEVRIAAGHDILRIEDGRIARVWSITGTRRL